MTVIQVRRGNAAQWSSVNPVLAAGEIGFEQDTNKIKVGNGSSAWAVLPYFGGSSSVAFADVTGKPTTLAGYGITDAASATHNHSGLYSALGHGHSAGDVSGLAAVATSGAYSSLTGLPTLGTVAGLNVAASGDAAAGEVVKGGDSRLNDARTPTAHSQAWSTITSTPTTLAGYGIGDAAAAGHDHSGIYQPVATVLTNTTASFTVALESKLSGIAAGAEVNVNADWSAVSGDSQILNKPALGGAAALEVGTTAGTVAAGDHSHAGLAPAGGASGTVLKKNSATDHDYSWQADNTGVGGSASISITEVSLGTQPVRSGRFTLTDAAITGTDKIMVSQAPGPYTGKGTLADEAEFTGPVTFSAVPGTGSATVHWSSAFRQRGNMKIHYMRG